MGSRAFNLVVVLFWLATMSWLMLVKVMPLLRTGDPPLAKSQLVEEQLDLPPACWRVQWNERDIGWAATKVESCPGGGSDVVSRVEFQRQAFDEIPGVVRRVLDAMLGSGARFDLSLHNRMHLDEQNRLTGFDSDVHLDHIEQPLFTVCGDVRGELLHVELFSAGDSLHQHVMRMGQSLIGDEFSPQPYMPHLYQGRTWTEQVFSPLPSPTSPGKVSSRIIQATVERSESVLWGAEVVPAWLVVYRDAEADAGKSSPPVGRMWVKRDGMVIRQEATLLGSRIRFERLSDAEAHSLADQLSEDWRAEITTPLPRPVPDASLETATLE